MKRTALVQCFFALLGSVAAVPATVEAAAGLPNDVQFVGSIGCNSSSCHGGAGEKRSQYLTWVKYDYHFRAYAVLVNARSARMAESLGLGPAQTSPRCTVCHSPFQAVHVFTPARLTNKAETDEGVSCENCHGAAGSWLRGHTRKDWTYATRVGAGMHDLRNFYVRANTCVACHQNVDADLLSKGHPELTFEMDGQSVAEPEHWREPDPWCGPRAWLVGQAVALREISWALVKSEIPDEDTTTRWSALVWLLGKTTANQTQLEVIDPPVLSPSRALFVTMQSQADLLARQAAAISWDERRTTGMLRVLGATDSEFVVSSTVTSELLFRRAQRLVLALDRLSRPLSHQAAASTKSPALVALFDDVRVRPDFRPAKFAADLASFRATMEPAP